MNILKIDGGKLELRSDRGSFIRTIAHRDVVDADLNDDGMILVTLINGKVELRKENGSFVRTIAYRDAVSARWNGENVLIRLSNGKMELRKENGLTVEKLSELVGTSDPRALYKWRRGVTLPSLDNLIALAEIFRTPVDYIIVRRKTKER